MATPLASRPFFSNVQLTARIRKNSDRGSMNKQESAPPLYGLVGDGRLARHWSHYLSLLNLDFVSWSRRRPQPGLERCEVLLLAIRDDALADFCAEFRKQQGSDLRDRPVVHFSGALVIPGMTGMHPLQSFGPELYAEARYREIPFLVEEGGTAFAEVFPTLPNPHFTIPATEKARYHAHCVLSGNFATLLWQRLFRYLETELKLPADIALPYLRQITENLARNPTAALTGPLARGDVETLRRDLAGLANDAHARRLFESFVETERPDLALQLKGTPQWTS